MRTGAALSLGAPATSRCSHVGKGKDCSVGRSRMPGGRLPRRSHHGGGAFRQHPGHSRRGLGIRLWCCPCVDCRLRGEPVAQPEPQHQPEQYAFAQYQSLSQPEPQYQP
jgi:hypothetical protein